MDRKNQQLFIENAAADLASVRISLLVIAQTGGAIDLSIQRRNLDRLKAGALENGQPATAARIAACESALERITALDDPSPAAVYAALDTVTRIEAALFSGPLHSDQLFPDITGFVDASFNGLTPASAGQGKSDRDKEEFELNDEILDIFRSEANELITNIANNLKVLSRSPGDQNALWDIRRNAHTFKGAAGIVGLKDASAIAHRMEDLLDKMVEMRYEAVPQVVDFLDISARRLNAIVSAKNIDETGELERRYETLISWLSLPVETKGKQLDGGNLPNGNAPPDFATMGRAYLPKTALSPIVRVSLDRLDDLIKVSRGLSKNQAALTARFTEFSRERDCDVESLEKLESIFEAQRQLTNEMHAKLIGIRMVKFGALETRLSRAVHVTCQDENKKAAIELENGEVEIDTQIIDALIEPLLHLLKNAVVHGIEPPETRRLIGKPEQGSIRIRVEADDEALVLSVADDGRGISLPKLKEKAIVNLCISKAAAESMDDREAVKLIFERGVTTAEKIDLNAGRGVGMSIVKESVESRGGSVLVDSEPQRGTTFTILMPLTIAKAEPMPTQTRSEESALKSAKNLSPLVLIVDDSPSIRHQMTKLVEDAGLRSITAINGAEALELLLSGGWEPSLILSDIEMPQINGWEFLEYVKTDDNFGHIPVVMVTSLDTDEHRQKAISLGASDYLVKPFSGKDMERIFETFCSPIAV